MATSPLFGWEEPDDTDLVKDGAAAIRTLGNAIDTSMGDLLGGTTGQILAKNSNTNMDFTWIANDQGDITGITATSPLTGGGTSGAITVGIQAASTTQSGAVQLSDSTSTTSSVLAATPTAVKAAYDKASTAATTSVAGIVQLSDSTSTTSSVLASTPTATKSAYDLAAAAIPNSTVTTAGDLIYRNATVPARLGIGTAGQVLTVNSGATAPEWTTIATGGLTLLSTTTITSATTTISSISGSYNYLLIYINNLGTTNANPNLAITFNGASTFQGINSTAYDATAAAQFALNNSALTNASHPYSGGSGAQYQSGVLTLNNYSNATHYKPITYNETFYNSAGQQVSSFYTGKLKTTSAITSMTVTWGGTTGMTGTVKIYGGN